MSNFYKKSHNYQKANERGFIFSLLILIALIAFLVWLGFYAVQLNQTVINKFENRKWDIPATLYSRPLTITPDSTITPAQLDAWLGLLNYNKANLNKTGTYQKTNQTYTIHTRGFDYGDGDTDSDAIIEIGFTDNKLTSLKSTKPNNKGMVRLEPVNFGGIYPTNNEDRQLINAEQMPQTLIDALIATEDRSFYEHQGVSLRGIGRAIVANVSGKPMQGGSTITQQLIKNFYLNSERTLKRKLNEAMMAILLEMRYSKQEILLAYMNEINLGQNGNRSVNGFGIASQFYFNKPLGELSLDQYALLVGIAKGPSHYNPRKHPERALERRNVVLNNMLTMGKIDQQTYEKARKKPLGVVKTPSIAKSPFPDFLDMVQRELKKYYKDEDLQNRGLKIISTLDPLAQTAASRAVSRQLSTLRNKNSSTKNLQAALVSADPATGEMLALVGSGDEFTGFNRAIDSKRQVGSLLKPAIYLTALQSGRYQLISPINDEQITYQVGDSTWTPKNYDGISHAQVPLVTALANSYNQAAVNVGVEFGTGEFITQLKNLSITKPIPTYPSIMLGAVDLSPMDMLGMYQIFANSGAYTPLHSVRSVIDDQGRVVQRSVVNHQFRASPEAVYLLNYGLQQVIKSGTAKAAKAINGNLNLAGKTGTTNDYKDAWFAGYSGNYVSVVWVGRDDNKPIGLSGGTGALPIWQDFMGQLPLRAVNLPKPQGVDWQWINTQTGELSHELCPNTRYLPIISVYQTKGHDECAIQIAEQARLLELAMQQAQAFDDGTIDAFDEQIDNQTNANNTTNDEQNIVDAWADYVIDGDFFEPTPSPSNEQTP